MKFYIAIKYRQAIVMDLDKITFKDNSEFNPLMDVSLPDSLLNQNYDFKNDVIIASLIASMMQLGFIPTKELYKVFINLDKNQIVDIYNNIISILKNLKGDDVKYEPFYPNFPEQVMEMDHLSLFMMAIMHYWTSGYWKPDFKKLPRQFAFEDIDFKEIGIISEDNFKLIFNNLVSSNESLSDDDKKVIKWFFDNYNEKELSLEALEIPFKENLCYIASLMIEKNRDITKLIKTATDILRIAVALSDGDISLATNTKFISFPRSTRRIFAKALEKVASEEDINRHRGKWIKLFHSLHIGEYSEQLYKLAKKIRNNEKIETFNGKVQKAIDDVNIELAVELLIQRPGEFTRKIDHLLRMAPQNEALIISEFTKVIDKVNSRVLLQLLGNLKIRNEDVLKRIVFPKGMVQCATIIQNQLPALTDTAIDELSFVIKNTLKNRFKGLEYLGKVWIDPELKNCPLPTQQRSTSKGLFQVARGTHLPFRDDKGTLRFFIYWVGQDIDLSATLHDENFEEIEHISYTNLKSSQYQAYHSGDIVQAPKGASEFIDITIDDAVNYGARYVVMNVLVYNGPTFAEHKKVYAGWMTRSKPKSNEIYDPKTVEQKIDLTSKSKNSIPVVFDLVERKAIWADLNTTNNYYYGGNNIESNRASIAESLEAIVTNANKVSLYELFTLHGESRGEIVDIKEEADIIFSISEGITPYNISIINSEYLI